MRVGKALAAEIRHRVRLAPNHIIQDPIARILQGCADSENIVIASNHPDRAIGLENASCRFQPVAGERVIGCKAVELIPVIVNRIHLGVIRAMQICFELQVIGWIGEDKINAVVRE